MEQFRSNTIQSTNTRTFSILLALCLAGVLHAGGLRAQAFSPVQYNFQAAPESAPTSYAYAGFNYDEILNSMAPKMIFGATATGYFCVIGMNGSNPDNGLDANYYQVTTSSYYTPAGKNPETEFGGNVLFNSTSGTVSILTTAPGFPSMECWANNVRTKKGKAILTAETDTTSPDECYRLANKAEELTGVNDQEAYDTTKAYLTLCPNAYSAIGMFSEAGANVDGIAHAYNDGHPAIYDQFREWLKSILYLRMDSSWYCADVYEILHTFLYYSGHGFYPNGGEAVIRYILENNRCDSGWSAMFAQGNNWPQVVYNVWQDTVKDSLTEPRPDTTVPSIDSIGLSILRGAPAGVAPMPIAPDAEQFSGLYVTENPFTQSTAIKFTLADYGLVTFQLFDVLGHAVTTNGIGQVLYPGAHEFDIDGSKLLPGNYIARVAFHNGDVESIMVVRK